MFFSLFSRRPKIKKDAMVLYVHPNPAPGEKNNVITRVLSVMPAHKTCIIRWERTTMVVAQSHCTVLPIDNRSDLHIPEKPKARVRRYSDRSDTFLEEGARLHPLDHISDFGSNQALLSPIPLSWFGYTLTKEEGKLSVAN